MSTRRHHARWHGNGDASRPRVLCDVGSPLLRPCACGGRLPWFADWPRPEPSSMCSTCIVTALVEERKAGRVTGTVSPYHFFALMHALGVEDHGKASFAWDPRDGWPAMTVWLDEPERPLDPNVVRIRYER